jgi:hypothetical protein
MIKNAVAKTERRTSQRAMSIGWFCERYAIGRTLVYSEINDGRLRARKCRRRILIAEADAEEWLRCLPTVVEASA